MIPSVPSLKEHFARELEVAKTEFEREIVKQHEDTRIEIQKAKAQKEPHGPEKGGAWAQSEKATKVRQHRKSETTETQIGNRNVAEKEFAVCWAELEQQIKIERETETAQTATAEAAQSAKEEAEAKAVAHFEIKKAKYTRRIRYCIY